MSFSEEINRSWEQNAAAWTRAVREGLIPSRRIATDQAIVDAVMARQPRRVLDAGCGEGWLLRRLRDAGVRDLVGFDASAALIQSIPEWLGATLHVATYDEVARGAVSFGERFDVIICNFAILEEHIGAYLRGLGGLLRSNGVLFIQTLADSPLETCGEWRTETFQTMDGTWEPMPYFFRTAEGWRRVLRENGLRLVSVLEPADPASGRTLSMLLTVGSERAEV